MDRGTLRTLVRSLIDEPSADFWSDAELNTWLNLGQRHYVNKIEQAFEGFFGTTALISYVANQQLYNLPSDLMRIGRVERVDFTQPVEVYPVSLNQKELFNRTPAVQATSAEAAEFYFLWGDQIGIVPTPNVAIANNLKLWYIPRIADMSADGTEPFSGKLVQHHEIVAYFAAIQAYTKDEADTSLLDKELARLDRQLVNSIENRQIQKPRYVK